MTAPFLQTSSASGLLVSWGWLLSILLASSAYAASGRGAAAFIPQGLTLRPRGPSSVGTLYRRPLSSTIFPTTSTKMVLFQESGQEEEQRAANSTSLAAAGATKPPSEGPNKMEVKIEGIGGKGGVVYDVNRLKRNLLAETMSNYKKDFLSSTRTNDADVVEKLFALIQASPVRTTTDSNILDTDDAWVLAYRSYCPTSVSSLILYDSERASQYNARYNFLWNQSPGDAGTMAKKENVILSKIKEFFQTKHRCFRLEDLKDDEDAYVTDTTNVFGGFFTKIKHYSVQGLTRCSIELQKESTKWSLLGLSSAKNHTEDSSRPPKRMTIFIVYLDNDLMILSEQGGPDSPFYVYTRNEAYLSNYRTIQRKLNTLQAAAKSALTFPLLKAKLLSPRKHSGASDPILKEIIHNKSTAARLRVLRLGDLDNDREDESWESASDPFVHLSGDERQRLLKAMSVRQIDEAAQTYRNSQRRFRWIQRIFNRRKTYFKKPQNLK